MKALYEQFDYQLSQAFAVLNDYTFETSFNLKQLDDKHFEELVDLVSEEVSSFENGYTYEEINHYKDLIDDFLEENNLK